MSLQKPSRASLFATSIAILLWLSAASPAFSQAVSEDQVKAAYVYSFAKFIEWPSRTFTGPSSSFHFCVSDDRPLQVELGRTVKDKLVAGHTIEVISIDGIEQSRGCHLLFIGASLRQARSQMMDGLRGANILTIGETANFIDEGGMIGFLLEDERVHFEINHKAATLSGLYISSRLLSVAKRVIE